MSMTKRQLNIRASELTHRQLERLMEWWGVSQTEALTVIVDRAYRDELEKHQEAIVNEPTAAHDAASNQI